MKCIMQRQPETLYVSLVACLFFLLTANVCGDEMAMASMQGGAAPADTRDPNAYADGRERQSGEFIPDGVKPLHLMGEHLFWAVEAKRLEWVDASPDELTAYELEAWIGGSYRRAVVKLEGDVQAGDLEESENQLLFSQAIAPYWDARIGVRADTGIGPDRRWLALAIDGVAPYWIHTNISLYVGDHNRSALVAELEYEAHLTQRWILEPRINATAYSRADDTAGYGSGFSNASVGLRLRYDITRQFSPYLGVEHVAQFGRTADMTRGEGGNVRDTRVLAGIHFWF